MSDKTQNPEPEIERPWAVYGWFSGSHGIGKVVHKTKHYLDLQYSEGQFYPLECWDPKWVHTFDNPVQAMAYFLVHSQYRHSDNPYNQRTILERFLRDFPSERANIEKLLPKRFESAKISKCPWADAHVRLSQQRDEGPFGPHPYKKDDGFVHPNKRYLSEESQWEDDGGSAQMPAKSIEQISGEHHFPGKHGSF